MGASVLKIGDVVKLKSGGPPMTVSIATEENIECSWFVEGSIQHSSFTPGSLKTFHGKNGVKTLKAEE